MTARRNGQQIHARLCAVVLSAAMVATAVVAATLPASAAVPGAAQVVTDRAVYDGSAMIVANGSVSYVRKCADHGLGDPPRKDNFLAIANVHVVTDRPTVGAKIGDVSGRPNTVLGTVAGGFVQEVIGFTGRRASALPPGDYDIVVDECQDGIFDNLDTYIPDAFRVRSSDRLPDPLIEAQISLMKNKAEDMHEAMGEAAGRFGTMLTVLSLKQSFDQVNVLDPSGLASSWFSYALEASFQHMTGGADPKRGGLQAIDAAADRYAGIAADPPDPDFQAVPAIALTGPTRLPPADPDLLAAQRLVDEVAIDGALAQAFLAALERYQGAQQVGNGPWGVSHLRTASAVADQLTARLRTQATRWDTFFAPSVWWASTNSSVASIWQSSLLRAHYFHPEARHQALGNLGLEETEGMERVLSYFVGFDGLTATVSVGEHQATHDRVAAAYLDMADTFEVLASDLDQVATDLAASEPWVRADEVPTVDAGGPYSTASGAPLQLVAAATGGTGLDVAWDLDGDGAFDDASGTATTTERFDVPGATYLVAARATNPANGFAGVGYALVEVSGDAPAVDAYAPKPRSAVIDVPGGSQTFEVTRAAGTVEWFLDGSAVATGTSWEYAPTPDEQGSHTVTGVVTGAGGGQSSVSFTVQVVGVDGDGDGWTAAPGGLDCDDNDPAVNPWEGEVLGNDIDDDCDPSTPDEGQPPTNLTWPPRAIVPQITNVTTPHFVEEGQTLVGGDVNWSHPGRTDPSTSFTIVVDWGDGTTQRTSFTGSPSKDDTSLPTLVEPHRYTSEGVRVVELCIEAPGVADPPPRACTQREFEVINATPAVNVDDLSGEVRTPRRIVPHGAGARIGPDWRIDDFGTLAYMLTNAAGLNMLPTADTAAGYGRFRVDTAFDGNFTRQDDDFMGLAMQLDPSEPTAEDGRYLVVGFTRGGTGGSPATDCGTENPAPAVQPMEQGLYLWDVIGVPAEQEFYDGRVLSSTGADAPDHCTDDQGTIRVAAARNGSPEAGWGTRVSRRQDLGSGKRHTLEAVEVEYQPDGLTVYADGVEELTYEPPSGEVFPPSTAAAAWNLSQAGTFYRAYELEQHHAVTEGELLEVAQPVADGGTEDVLVGTVTFGDAGPAAAASIVPDPARPPGWYTASATHAWDDDGTYRGSTCVDDGLEQGCFPFTVAVDNAPPVVDAGPDRDGGIVTLTPTFVDPGVGDVHTATIDWGDGTQDTFTTDETQVTDGIGYLPVTSHRYATAGTRTVTVTVTDDDGGVGSDTLVATVTDPNPPPTALLLVEPAQVAVPTPVGVGFDDDGGEHEMTVDLGDGLGHRPVPDVQDLGRHGEGTLTHTYMTAGTYDVEACVVDDDGGRDCTQDRLVVAAGTDGEPDPGGGGGTGDDDDPDDDPDPVDPTDPVDPVDPSASDPTGADPGEPTATAVDEPTDDQSGDPPEGDSDVLGSAVDADDDGDHGDRVPDAGVYALRIGALAAWLLLVGMLLTRRRRDPATDGTTPPRH